MKGIALRSFDENVAGKSAKMSNADAKYSALAGKLKLCGLYIHLSIFSW